MNSCLTEPNSRSQVVILFLHRLHINCLPEEILVKIFSYLPANTISQSVLPVCKHW